MKFTVSIFIILACTKLVSPQLENITVPNCAAKNFCQKCIDTLCTRCFTWGIGIDKDKAFDIYGGAACTADITSSYKVIDCLINYGSSATMYAQQDIKEPIHPRCSICDNKKYLYYDTNLLEETCSDIPPKNMKTCTEIENCVQTICITNLLYQLCIQCNENFYPFDKHEVMGYPQSCAIAGDPITNCKYYGYYMADGEIPSIGCFGCVTGYAVNFSYTCTAWVDDNCVTLTSDTRYCLECWPGYYFSGSTCTKKALFLVYAFVVFFIAVFL